nr:phospholipase-like protein [Tanacetum cinerariifolium]
MVGQLIQKKQEEKQIQEDQAANTRYWKIPAYYDDDDDYNSPITPNETVDSLIMGDKHLDTIPATESDEFIKSSGENLVPNPSIDIENMIADQSFAQLYNGDAVSLCCLGILQLVILGVESRRVVPDWMLRLTNDRVAWNKYPWGSYVWPTLYSQLRNANIKRWSPLYVAQPTNEDDVKTYSIFGYTWAFKGNMHATRLTTDDNEARSDWWISSKAYFNGFIGQVEQGYATDILSQPGSYYSFGQVPSHMGRPNLQTTIETHHDVDGILDQNILNRGKKEQFPSKYKLTPFMEQPPTTILPKQCVNKTKNKGKKANLSPLNLGGAFEDDNVEDNNIMFLGSLFTSNFLMYENVDPTKEDQVRQLAMMNLAHEFNDASTAKDELGKAYEKCRDIPLEQRDLIENRS